jgi:hypothetical protein
VPARNVYHDHVTAALTTDGWTITHDPLPVSYGDRDLYVDLGAERVTLGAEKGMRRIAVEVQSFIGPSPVRLLQEAVGQYLVYRTLIAETDLERPRYMAVPRAVDENLLSERFGQLIVARLQVRLMVFDPTTRRVVRWSEPNVTDKLSPS